MDPKTPRVAIDLELENIDDFLDELKHRQLDRIYRTSWKRDRGYNDAAEDTWNGHCYTAYDAAGDCFLRLQHRLPEMTTVDLVATNNDRNVSCKVERDKLLYSTSNKRNIAMVIERLGGNYDVAKELRTIRIADLHATVDALETDPKEEGEHPGLLCGARNRDIRNKSEHGFKEVEITLNLLDGLITKGTLRIEKSGPDLAYAVIISGWRAIHQAVLLRHEQKLLDAGIRVIAGKLNVSREGSWLVK